MDKRGRNTDSGRTVKTDGDSVQGLRISSERLETKTGPAFSSGRSRTGDVQKEGVSDETVI